MLYDFIDFVSEGRLGSIRLGTSPSDLITALGSTDETGSSGRKQKIVLLRYGPIQIHLSPSIGVCFIGVYFHTPELIVPPTIQFGATWPTYGSTIQELETLFRTHRLDIKVDSMLTFDTQTCWRAGKAHVSFDMPGGILDSVQVSATE